jgi:hypothetical protein
VIAVGLTLKTTSIPWWPKSLSDDLAPVIDNAIGAGVAQGVDSIRNAINTTLLGPRQFELDSLIDSPIYHSPDYYGDFGVSFPMGTFIDRGGGCGVVADMDPSLIPELCSV